MSMQMDHTEPVSEAAEHRGHGPHGPGYETKDANVYALLTFGAGLVIALVVIQLAMLGFYRVFQRYEPKKQGPQTKVQENLYQQLRTLRENEEGALGKYGWVDRKAGVVRIPIDRAIALVAEKGVRFGKGPKSELEMNSHAGTPVDVPSADRGAASPPASTGPKP